MPDSLSPQVDNERLSVPSKFAVLAQPDVWVLLQPLLTSFLFSTIRAPLETKPIIEENQAPILQMVIACSRAISLENAEGIFTAYLTPNRK